MATLKIETDRLNGRDVERLIIEDLDDTNNDKEAYKIVKDARDLAKQYAHATYAQAAWGYAFNECLGYDDGGEGLRVAKQAATVFLRPSLIELVRHTDEWGGMRSLNIVLNGDGCTFSVYVETDKTREVGFKSTCKAYKSNEGEIIGYEGENPQELVFAYGVNTLKTFLNVQHAELFGSVMRYAEHAKGGL